MVSRYFFYLIGTLILISVQLNAETLKTSDQWIAKAKSLGLSQDKQWIRMLHFTEHRSPRESEIDAPTFFLAQNGKTDPLAELVETLRGIESSAAQPEELNVSCKFPARRQWLQKRLAEIAPFPVVSCPRFQNWHKTLVGPSVSIVFSSYFLNNPSSAFGHTLMRINKAPSELDGRRHELLDYGINFAANVPEDANPVAFAFKGLFGFYPGVYSAMPYYYKVREYNNAESRDLWEYELGLTPEQVSFMVAHLWELGPTYSDYWYLTENCSYQMITLLEVANPDLDLSVHLQKYVIPSDTVQILFEVPGLVRSYHLRPSIGTELRYRLNRLSEEEKNFVLDLVAHRDLPSFLKEDIAPDRRALILDAVADRVDFLFPTEVQMKETPEARWKDQVLAARAKVNFVSPRLQASSQTLDRPHLSHGSRRMSLGAASQTSNQSGSSTALLFRYRFALHDRLDPVGGYPDYAEISFADLHFSFDEFQRRLELEKLNLVEVISRSPFTRFTPGLSWAAGVGVDRLWYRDCVGCHALVVNGGVGLTFEWGDQPGWSAYGGVGAKSYTAPAAPGNRIFLGGGPELQLRRVIHPSWIAMSGASYFRDVNRENSSENIEWSIATQYSFDSGRAGRRADDNGLRLVWKDRQFQRMLELQWQIYY